MPPQDNRPPQQVAPAGDLPHPAKGRKRPQTLPSHKKGREVPPSLSHRVSRPWRRKEPCFRLALALRWTHPAEDRATQGCDLSADLGAGGLTAPCLKAGEGKPSPAFLFPWVETGILPNAENPGGVRGGRASPYCHSSGWPSSLSRSILISVTAAVFTSAFPARIVSARPITQTRRTLCPVNCSGRCPSRTPRIMTRCVLNITITSSSSPSHH
jgi:hypothetical protein